MKKSKTKTLQDKYVKIAPKVDTLVTNSCKYPKILPKNDSNSQQLPALQNETVPMKKMTFKCESCQTSYPTRFGLNQHIRKKHVSMPSRHTGKILSASDIPVISRYDLNIQQYLYESLADDPCLKYKQLTVRTVTHVKKMIKIDEQIQKLMNIPAKSFLFGMRTVLLFEKRDGAESIIFSMFIRDDKDTKTSYVTHFGAPPFLRFIDPSEAMFYSHVFERFVIGNMAAIVNSGAINRIIFLTNSAKSKRDEVFPSYFHPPNQVNSSWITSMLEEASESKCIIDGTGLFGNAHFSSSDLISCLLAESDCDAQLFDRTVSQLLTRVSQELLVKQDSAAIGMQMFQLMAEEREESIVVPLFQPNTHFSEKCCCCFNAFKGHPSYLLSPRRFGDFCRLLNWDFSLLLTAVLSTSLILRDIVSKK